MSDNDKTLFYEWNDFSRPLHKLDLGSDKIWWNEAGDLVGLATEEKLLIFSFNSKNFSLTEIISLN